MSSSGVARMDPPVRTRIRPGCSTMNIRPVPSRALVMSTGFDSPLATGVNLIELDETAGETIIDHPIGSDERRGGRRHAGGEDGAREHRACEHDAAEPVGRDGGRHQIVFPALVRWSPDRSGRPYGAVNSARGVDPGRVRLHDHDLQPYLRRPEHDRAAARGPRQGARPAFGRAFDDPAHGFLRPVDLDLARRQHTASSRPSTASASRSAYWTRKPTTPTSSTFSTPCSSPTAARSRCGRASRIGRGSRRSSSGGR